ncbi:hypothetical protein ACFVVA_32340 [Kitasatospora sp. NPDC058048]|uniref:hypothetical protein n=1 Tax=Kitasatospora sp. NPDC058048 TaxID=3346313 RepID=UPI0036DEAB79
MDLHPLLAAIERGDDTTVFEFLADVAIGGLDRDDGTTLLAAAAYAGIRRGIKNRRSHGAGRLDDLHHQLLARTPGM